MKQNIIIVLLSAICGILGYMAAQMQDRPAAVQVANSELVSDTDRLTDSLPAESAVPAKAAEPAKQATASRKCRKIGLPNPPYPEDAQNAGIGGSVTLEFEVSDEGRGQNAVIIKSSGNDSLDSMALRAAQKGIYSKGNSECFRTTFDFVPS
ncbi:energy transducer TonB [Kingella sp. SNUBH-2017]|uniref:energy transducer TonB n=1 Tax=Kingella sp. SNUBH-2017 TaxID=2994077 RepID=UPI002363AD8B|nr:energy transducer TonB [Kingella sp. SNUBH-2017]MDD2182159.1 energy transducer TonB [Kingella sp. SNUBH-2017]